MREPGQRNLSLSKTDFVRPRPVRTTTSQIPILFYFQTMNPFLFSSSFIQRRRSLAGALSTAFALTIAAFPVLSPTSADATVINLPGVMAQGGMAMTSVYYDSGTSTFSFGDIDFPAGQTQLVLKSVRDWSGNPTATLNPSSIYYSLLDPTQGAGLYSTQFAFYDDTGTLPVLGANQQIAFQLLSFSEGLSFHYSSGDATPIFTAATDYTTVWNGRGMWHLQVVLDPAYAGQSVSATFQAVVVDTTTLAVISGYNSETITLTYASAAAVPEPAATAAILGTGVLVMVLLKRNRERNSPAVR
jgi:hypothetical protein